MSNKLDSTTVVLELTKIIELLLDAIEKDCVISIEGLRKVDTAQKMFHELFENNLTPIA